MARHGKAQRGRWRHSAAPAHPIHAVTAVCHARGGAMAQRIVDAPQHEAELTVAPDAIRPIDGQRRNLTGATLDGQQALCAQVVAAGGDERLIVKERQLTLVRDIQPVIAPLTGDEQARRGIHTVQPLARPTYRTVEKGHGRLEERRIRVSSELAGYRFWPYLAQLFETSLARIPPDRA